MFDFLEDLINLLLELLVPDVLMYYDYFVPVVLILWLVFTIFYKKWSSDLKQHLLTLFGEKWENVVTDLVILIRVFYIYISFISFSIFFMLIVAGYF